MGKKGKGKKVDFATDDAALAPFEVSMRDIIATPLGVQCTVIGVKEGALWLEWPGGIQSPASPAPSKVKCKSDLETYGYNRRPQSSHIQRSINERLQAQYMQRRYGAAGPKTASINLPLGECRLELGTHGCDAARATDAMASHTCPYVETRLFRRAKWSCGIGRIRSLRGHGCQSTADGAVINTGVPPDRSLGD